MSRCGIMSKKGWDIVKYEFLLRVLTGRVAGYYMLRELNKVSFISCDDKLCISLASAAAASFIDRTGGVATILTITKDNVVDIVDEVENNAFQAVFLAFGGEEDPDEVKDLFVSFLNEISERNLEVDIILHIKIFAMGGLEKALENKDVSLYLQAGNNLYVYTADFEKGFLILNFVEVHGDHIHIQEVEKFPVSLEHAELLNKILRGKELHWRDI